MRPTNYELFISVAFWFYSLLHKKGNKNFYIIMNMDDLVYSWTPFIFFLREEIF